MSHFFVFFLVKFVFYKAFLMSSLELLAQDYLHETNKNSTSSGI